MDPYLSFKKYILQQLFIVVSKYEHVCTCTSYSTEFSIFIRFISNSKIETILFIDHNSIQLQYFGRCIVDDIEEQGLYNNIYIKIQLVNLNIILDTSYKYLERYSMSIKVPKTIWILFSSTRIGMPLELYGYVKDIPMVMFL